MAVDTKPKKRKATASDPTPALTKKPKTVEKVKKATKITKDDANGSSVAKDAVTSESNGNPTTVISRTTSKSSNGLPKARKKKSKEEAKIVVEDPEDSEVEAREDDEDDQTAALLAGFSSSSEDEDGDGIALPQTDPVPDIPSAATKALSKQSKATSKSTKSGNEEERGVVVLSRVPHGFYEHQMRAYFSQFGEITNLRMARNRRTGASKHYAFIEFSSAEVAKIVATTMDNYLMFGHRLKVKMLSKEQVHPELWKGANKRFRPVPWNRIEKTRVAKTDRKGWEKRVKAEKARRGKKIERLRELGYEFEAPSLKQVSEVPIRIEEKQEIENGDQVKAIEATPVEKQTVEELIAGAQAIDGGDVVEEVIAKSSKRNGKDETVKEIKRTKDPFGTKVSKSSKKKRKVIS